MTGLCLSESQEGIRMRDQHWVQPPLSSGLDWKLRKLLASVTMNQQPTLHPERYLQMSTLSVWFY